MINGSEDEKVENAYILFNGYFVDLRATQGVLNNIYIDFVNYHAAKTQANADVGALSTVLLRIFSRFSDAPGTDRKLDSHKLAVFFDNVLPYYESQISSEVSCAGDNNVIDIECRSYVANNLNFSSYHQMTRVEFTLANSQTEFNILIPVKVVPIDTA